MILQDSPTLLAQFGLFNALNDAERDRMSRRLVVQSRAKGELLFRSAVAAPLLYLVHQGQIKLSRYSDDGREIILDFRRAGDVVGELALVGWAQQDDVAEVAEQALVSAIPINELTPLLGSNCLFNTQVTHLVVQRLKQMQHRYESLCFQGASSRIRQFIREQADAVGRHVGTEIDVKMSLTHQDIAKMTITSRQLVTGVLRDLKRQNVITYNRNRILVRNYQALL